MTSFPLVQAQYINGNLVYKTKLNYKRFGSRTLPYKLYEQYPATGDLLSEVFDAYELQRTRVDGAIKIIVDMPEKN